MEKYQVLKRIGVGTYGSAYLVAPRNGSHVQYVLKKIKLDASNEKEQNQAEMEVMVLAQLNHPLVLGYIDHFQYKSHLCIVTDYCEGGDLYQLLRARKTPLTEAAVLEYFVQVVLAIQYVHQQNILHRDLKTQNIFLTRDGNIKLGDFGIARSLNSTMDLASTIIGTPYYMSPEVMSSLPYDYKSDMWSMGCVLYEMMSLKHAFDATDMSSLVLKILRGEHLPLPPQFSAEIKDLVKQLLSKSPKQRPSPEQVLKMPFIKEYVSRARETVSQLQGQQSGRQHRAPSQDMGSSSDLDRELEAAKERLRRIQLERDVLNKQVLSVQKEQASTSGRAPLVSAQSLPVAAPPGRRHAQQPPAARGPEVVSSGRSPPMAPAAQGRALSADMADFSHITDPKARAAARKAEDIRRREAELLEVRKTYFEERKQADLKMRQMYQPTGTVGGLTASSRRAERASEQQQYGGLAGGPSSSNVANAFSRGSAPAMTVDSSDDEFEDHGRDRGAAQELEAELAAVPKAHDVMPLNTFNNGALVDKIKALRSMCSTNLGQQLHDLIYGFLRQRNAGADGHRSGLNDDHAFRQELMTRLGPNRMQYVHLIDQLIYYEELLGRA